MEPALEKPASTDQAQPEASTSGRDESQEPQPQWEQVFDELILTAMRQPFSKDRALLLAADTELQALLSDSEATLVPFERFGTLNSFQRSVSHPFHSLIVLSRAHSRRFIASHTNSLASALILFAGDPSHDRLLLHRLGDAYKVKRVMIPISAPASAEHPGPQPLPNSHLVLSKTTESVLPALKLADLAAKIDAERPPLPAVFASPSATTTSYQANSSAPSSPLVSTNGTRSTTPISEEAPSIRIMARQNASTSSAVPSGSSSRTSSASGKDKRPGLTLEQREAAYQQARERIFKEEEEKAAAAAAAAASKTSAPQTHDRASPGTNSLNQSQRPASEPRPSRTAAPMDQHQPRLRPSAPAFDPTGGPSGFVFYPPAPSTSASSTTHLPPPPEGYEYPPSPPLDPEEEQHSHLHHEYTRGDPVIMMQAAAAAPPPPQGAPVQGYFVVPHHSPSASYASSQQTADGLQLPRHVDYHYYRHHHTQDGPQASSSSSSSSQTHSQYQPAHSPVGYYVYHPPPQPAAGPCPPHMTQAPPPPPPLPHILPQHQHSQNATSQQPVYYYTVASTQPPPTHLQPQPLHSPQHAISPAAPISGPGPSSSSSSSGRYVPFPSASETASNASSSASTAEYATSVNYELRPSSSSSSINSHPSLSSVPTLGTLGHHALVARAASEISAPSSSVSSAGSSRTSKTAASSFSSSSKPISLGPGLPPLGPMKENYHKPARSKRNGQRSNASQASDDLGSERLSEAGSIGAEREPHRECLFAPCFVVPTDGGSTFFVSALPSKPDWIKTKAVRKNSSSSSRAASVSSALSNSANSL